MDFDEIGYSMAIEEFIVKMEKINSIFHPDVSSVIAPVCQKLRVAELSAHFYENMLDYKNGNGKSLTMYSNPESMADKNRVYAAKEETGIGSVVEYIFFQSSGDSDWSEKEIERIEIFRKLLFVYNSRTSLLSKVEYLSFHDTELGVHNISYFMHKVNNIIRCGKIGKYGACFFNLKNFSGVNQLIGRRMGTDVMKKYIFGLTEILSEDEVVCRIGGDNFAALFYKENLDKMKDYFCGVSIPYSDESFKTVHITSTAGFYMIPDDCPNATSIMDVISSAKNHISSAQFLFYNDEIMNKIQKSKNVELMFRDAIKNQEFLVYYQPKYSLKDYSVCGAEALCRWLHNGEMIQPMEFIPVLERSGLIGILDFYMLEHVCMDIRKWLDEGKKPVRVSVNLSRVNLCNSELLEGILAIVDSYKIPYEFIEIELTETTSETDFKELKNIINGLSANGISTAVDDFGVGYSSLNLISDLPWSVLKIDKKFLEVNEDNGSQNYVMLKHIISLAQSFGIECLVEGVETEEQVNVLKENNCFMAQGFYFDRPLPRDVFETRLSK